MFFQQSGGAHEDLADLFFGGGMGGGGGMTFTMGGGGIQFSMGGGRPMGGGAY